MCTIFTGMKVQVGSQHKWIDHIFHSPSGSTWDLISTAIQVKSHQHTLVCRVACSTSHHLWYIWHAVLDISQAIICGMQGYMFHKLIWAMVNRGDLYGRVNAVYLSTLFSQ